MEFESRAEAGAQLARRLLGLGSAWPLVLGLSRGGLGLAAPIAQALEAQLAPWLTQPVAAPGQPELPLGAVAEGEGLYLDPERLARTSETEVMLAASREAQALEGLALRLRGGRPGPEPGGRVVLLVDEGALTGARLLAAAEAVARRGPRQVVAAVPLASERAAQRLAGRVDALVCLRQLPQLPPRELWFGEAPPSERELGELLARAGAGRGAGAGR